MTHHPRSLRLGILLVLGAVSVGALLTPTAHAAAAQMLSVFVANTAANPVPVIARDPEASHEPWHLFMKQEDEYVVPGGKRLVIEYANGIVQLQGFDQPDWTLSVFEPTSGEGQGYHWIGQSLKACTDCFVMSESLRIYARAGSVVKPGFVPGGSELRLSGYLLDVP